MVFEKLVRDHWDFDELGSGTTWGTKNIQLTKNRGTLSMYHIWIWNLGINLDTSPLLPKAILITWSSHRKNKTLDIFDWRWTDKRG